MDSRRLSKQASQNTVRLSILQQPIPWASGSGTGGAQFVFPEVDTPKNKSWIQKVVNTSDPKHSHALNFAATHSLDFGCGTGGAQWVFPDMDTPKKGFQKVVQKKRTNTKGVSQFSANHSSGLWMWHWGSAWGVSKHGYTKPRLESRKIDPKQMGSRFHQPLCLLPDRLESRNMSQEWPKTQSGCQACSNIGQEPTTPIWALVLGRPVGLVQFLKCSEPCPLNVSTMTSPDWMASASLSAPPASRSATHLITPRLFWVKFSVVMAFRVSLWNATVTQPHTDLMRTLLEAIAFRVGQGFPLVSRRNTPYIDTSSFGGVWVRFPNSRLQLSSKIGSFPVAIWRRRPFREYELLMISRIASVFACPLGIFKASGVQEIQLNLMLFTKSIVDQQHHSPLKAESGAERQCSHQLASYIWLCCWVSNFSWL